MFSDFGKGRDIAISVVLTWQNCCEEQGDNSSVRTLNQYIVLCFLFCFFLWGWQLSYKARVYFFPDNSELWCTYLTRQWTNLLYKIYIYINKKLLKHLTTWPRSGWLVIAVKWHLTYFVLWSRLGSHSGHIQLGGRSRLGPTSTTLAWEQSVSLTLWGQTMSRTLWVILLLSTLEPKVVILCYKSTTNNNTTKNLHPCSSNLWPRTLLLVCSDLSKHGTSEWCQYKSSLICQCHCLQTPTFPPLNGDPWGGSFRAGLAKVFTSVNKGLDIETADTKCLLPGHCMGKSLVTPCHARWMAD